MLTAMAILAILALLFAVASAAGWCPLWVSVVLLAIIELLQHIPLGR